MAPVYTDAQVAQFLTHLEIPKEYYIGNEPILDHAFLNVLHQHMITMVPYENLTLHYGHRNITLEPEALFKKMVTDKRGRGGYCMENSLFFTYMLRALGFQVYPVGVRVRLRVNGVPQGGYPGWVHIVNIVTLPDNTQWVLDVSFGGDGPTQPIPLVENSVWRNMGTQEARLIRDFIPGQTELDPGRRLWIYQCRNGPGLPWVSFYAFNEKMEWLPEDFEVLNAYTGASPKSFQTFTVLVVKFLRRDCGKIGGEEVYGKKMLVGATLKENLGGKTRVVKECGSEEERVQVLREEFGIELTEEEREGIRGHKTEIVAQVEDERPMVG
ncbi:Fc.00g022700.m01.CDS01 [Cosmosporella sp. VM-42]